jgi:tetrahydromethanopterin S-methyltransferase subunit G
MAKAPPQIGEDTKVILDLKTIGLIISFVVGLATTYFTLKSDIALAMEMPKPEISKIEFDMKDELIRQTIMDTQDDVEMILEKLDKLDERIYEIQKGN